MTQPPEENAWDTFDWSVPFDLEKAPLDRPPGWDAIDWGGDGSDLSRPVRTHVLAALTPVDTPYPPPVDTLLHLGDPRNTEIEQLRQNPGLSQTHLDDLVRLARDRDLNTAVSNTPDVWAPIHALYALENLDVSPVVDDLIPLFDVPGDWHVKPLEAMVSKAGAAALEPLHRYLADTTRWAFGRGAAASTLEAIALRWPELRPQVVAILQKALQAAGQNDDTTNSFIIDSLVKLNAAEALPSIRHAFELNRVNMTMRGDWQQTLHDLGMKPDPADPLVEESARRAREQREQVSPSASSMQEQSWKPRQVLDQVARNVLDHADSRRRSPAPADLRGAASLTTPRMSGGQASSRSSSAADARKAKQKRKQESASRKANQHKKKRK